MADVGLVLDVELHQEVKVAGGRIDFRSELRVRELVRHLVGLAEVAFDLHEERDHSRLRVARGRRRQSSKYGCARQEPRPSSRRTASAGRHWERGAEDSRPWHGIQRGSTGYCHELSELLDY